MFNNDYIESLLKRWLEFSACESIAYNKCNCKYEIESRNKKLQDLNKTWDTTGLMGVIYAKSICEHMLYNTYTNMLDILVEPDVVKIQKDSAELWSEFNSEQVKDIEQAFMQLIQAIIAKTTSSKVIGEFSKQDIEVLWDCTRDTITGLDRCRVESYLQGGKIGELSYINSSIIVFETLAECLTTLEKVKDGIYLCYINNYGSADGWFGFFIKSNGNLLSVNERLHEAYPGQHQKSRNGRYLENKAYSLFPYGFIVEFTGGHDYLGYAKEHKIDCDKLEIFKLDKKAYMPVVLALYLIMRRFSNKPNDYKQVYVDSLMKVNLQPLLDCKALTVINNSALVETNNRFEIPFSTDDIISSRLGNKYSYDSNDKTKYYDEIGSFVDASDDNEVEDNKPGFYNNSRVPALKLIKYFGDGFKYDATATFVRPNLQLTSSASETEKEKYVNEIVGNKARMEMLAYYQARKQLAEHIKQNIRKEFDAFGGKTGVEKWFNNIVANNYDNILNILINNYINNPPCEYEPWCKPITSEGLIIYTMDHALGSTPFNKIPPRYYGSGNVPVIDSTNGKPCNLWFRIEVNNADGFKAIIGSDDELPKIMECYNSCRDSLGNSLLDATDAVTQVTLPYEDVRYNRRNYADQVTFDFCVGFSKSGWNKIVSKFKAEHLIK